MKAAFTTVLTIAVLLVGSAPARAAEPVPFNEAIPIVDSDGDEVYCVFNIQRNDEGTIVALEWADCRALLVSLNLTEGAVVSIEDWTAHLRDAFDRLERYMEDEPNYRNAQSVKTHLRTIISWADTEQEWARTHTLHPCVEGQQEQLGDAAEDIEKTMGRVLRAYESKNVAAISRLVPEVRLTFSEAALSLGFLIGFTDGLECPWLDDG